MSLMKKAIAVLDGWQNLLTGMNVSGTDRRLNTAVLNPTVLSQQELNALYRGDDIVARICDLPVNAMTKKEFFKVKSGDSEDAETISRAMETFKDLRAKKYIRKAMIWARLHGGSIVFMGVDDGQDQAEPLNIERIRSLKFLNVLDRWDLVIESVYSEAGEANFRQPETYRIQPQAVTASKEPKPIESAIIHESRLLRFDGIDIPEYEKARNQGWCDSAVTRVFEVIRDYQTSYSGAFQKMSEMGLKYMRIPGIATALKQDKEQMILQRLQLMNLALSAFKMIPMDKEEEIEYPEQRFQGLSQTLEKFDIRLSMALGWPATVLLGQSPKGLSATGESDLTNWYDFVEGERERVLDENLTRLMSVIFAAQKSKPQKWHIAYPSLWQQSDKEDAETKAKLAEADSKYIDLGVLTPDEVANSRFAGDEFGMDISLDMEARETVEIEPAEEIPGIPLRDEPQPDDRTDSIVKKGDKWLVVAESTGKVLGTHSSKEEAQKHLAAIEIAKKKRAE